MTIIIKYNQIYMFILLIIKLLQLFNLHFSKKKNKILFYFLKKIKIFYI